jgi:hypothetical protein
MTRVKKVVISSRYESRYIRKKPTAGGLCTNSDEHIAGAPTKCYATSTFYANQKIARWA